MPRVATRRQGRVRWWLHTHGHGLEALIADPDAVLGGPGSVAREAAGRKRLYRLAGEPALIVKVFTLPPGLARLRYWMRPSKARREARIAQRLTESGFRTAAPLATGEERRFGALHRSFSVIRELDARDLGDALREVEGEPKARRALLEAFGAFARRLHDGGVDQDDFAPNNFLVTDEADFVLIDFERCRLAEPLGVRRWTLLAKLHRHDLGISRCDRLRFLRTYLGPGADRAARRRAWQRIERAFRTVRARDARHARRAAFKPGRHIERDGEVWTVRARRDRPVRRLRLARREARRVWILAHQLERLDLPALRPVRLRPGNLELEDLGPSHESPDREHLLGEDRRRFERWGGFVHEPEWLLTAGGARLCDPRAFDLKL